MDRKYLRPLLAALILILAVCLGLELVQLRQDTLPQDTLPQDTADDLAQDLPLDATAGGTTGPEACPETKPIETESTPGTDLTPPDAPTEATEETPSYSLPPNMLPIG